jgi:hypothetical protein
MNTASFLIDKKAIYENIPERQTVPRSSKESRCRYSKVLIVRTEPVHFLGRMPHLRASRLNGMIIAASQLAIYNAQPKTIQAPVQEQAHHNARSGSEQVCRSKQKIALSHRQ